MTSGLQSKELRNSLAKAASRYEANLELAVGQDALGYLQLRGLPIAAARRFRLGVVDGGEGSEHPEYAGWLAIPYLTRAGVVSFKFRNLAEDATPKYIGPYETRLYNTLAMDAADRTGVLAICEGELDAITLELCGIPAVGVPGVQVYKKHPEWRELFNGYQRVLIFQDDDEPGRELAKQLHGDIGASSIIRLPGADVNDTFLAFGREGIRRAAGLEAD